MLHILPLELPLLCFICPGKSFIHIQPAVYHSSHDNYPPANRLQKLHKTHTYVIIYLENDPGISKPGYKVFINPKRTNPATRSPPIVPWLVTAAKANLEATAQSSGLAKKFGPSPFVGVIGVIDWFGRGGKPRGPPWNDKTIIAVNIL